MKLSQFTEEYATPKEEWALVHPINIMGGETGKPANQRLDIRRGK